MNIFSMISTFATCLYFSLGLYSLIINNKSSLNRLFFIVCLNLSIWSYFASYVYNASDINAILFSFPISCIGFFFYFSFNLHFCIKLSKIKLNFLFYLLLYLIPFVFFIMSVYDHRVYVNFIKDNNKWIFSFNKSSLWTISYTTFHTITVLISAIFLWIWKSEIKSKKIKKISIILIVANISTYPIATFMAFLAQDKPKGEAPIFFIIWILCSFYVILKYRFLSMTIELVSNYLISNINESIILLNDDLKIILVNKKTEELIKEKNDKIMNKDLYEIVLNYDLVKNEVDKMLKNQFKDFSCRIYYKGNDEPILMDANFSKVFDKFNDLIGILIIGNEVKELKQLKLFYKLSDREVEIIQLIIEGLSNKEIGANTNLTENTVKSHVMHIFNKLNVNGRVEMINLLTEYNLIPRGSGKKKILLVK